MNSRREPRCTTLVSMRERGGVLSTETTSSSRHEQQSASTTPRTAVAGPVSYVGFEMAARAKSLMSSVRFTTAVRVATTLRYVAVSMNGFSTMAASPHSTPIGAQLTVPSSATVVTIVSTITGRSPHQIDGRRNERVARLVPACSPWRRRAGRLVNAFAPVGARREALALRARTVEKAAQHGVSVFGRRRFRMELHTDDRVDPVLDRHDLAIIVRRRGDAEV